MRIDKPLFTGSYDDRALDIVGRDDRHSRRVCEVIVQELREPTVAAPAPPMGYRQLPFLPMPNVVHTVDPNLRVMDPNHAAVEVLYEGRMIVRNEWSMDNDPKHDPFRGQAMVRSIRSTLCEVIVHRTLPSLIKAVGLDPETVRLKGAMNRWINKRSKLKGPDGRQLNLREIKEVIEAEVQADKELRARWLESSEADADFVAKHDEDHDEILSEDR